MKSWRTTIGGILAAVGASLQAMDGVWDTIGTLMVAAGAALLGLSARDDNVSSEGGLAPKAVKKKG